MSHPNRVQPDGRFLATEARGMMMGNRGVLHDATGAIGGTRWAHRNWVCCTLSFKERRRAILAPGRYTELFFLDEAVALAAGHRPCAECRRADYEAWCVAWARAFGKRERAAEMDARLHAARAVPGARRLAHETGAARDLPVGSVFSRGGQAHLVTAEGAHAYDPSGYGPARPVPDGPVTILTNPVTRKVLAAGYRPATHASAITRS